MEQRGEMHGKGAKERKDGETTENVVWRRCQTRARKYII